MIAGRSARVRYDSPAFTSLKWQCRHAQLTYGDEATRQLVKYHDAEKRKNARCFIAFGIIPLLMRSRRADLP